MAKLIFGKIKILAKILVSKFEVWKGRHLAKLRRYLQCSVIYKDKFIFVDG